jgi:tRNA pseudouridine32 synthase/23S rRNA pseudouridine746 synthase
LFERSDGPAGPSPLLHAAANSIRRGRAGADALVVLMALAVVHADAHCAVVDKPAGFRSVPARGAEEDPALRDSVETRARDLFECPTAPIIVHRLDVDTSGLMVLGLTRAAHQRLSRQFMHRKVGKTYAALLDGSPPEQEGAVDLPLRVDWPNRPRQCVDHEQGRASRTLYRVVRQETCADGVVTQVAFRPMTGRTHQLRVHAATPAEQGGLGAPILGDPFYGDVAKAPRLMLHADFLAFWHPGTHEWVKFESPAAF